MPLQSCQKSKHKCKYFRGSYFQTNLLKVSWLPVFWWTKRETTHALCGCTSHFQEAEAVLWPFWSPSFWAFASVFSSAMVLGHVPYALPTAETPASFSHCQVPSGVWLRPPGDSATCRVRCPGVVHATSQVTCLSVCSVYSRGLQPQGAFHQHIESSHHSEQEGTILEVQKPIFIVIDHISPSPVTPENLGIARAPYLALFNFAAIWTVWRWCEEDY